MILAVSSRIGVVAYASPMTYIACRSRASRDHHDTTGRPADYVIELLESLVAGALWTGVFMLLALAAQHRLSVTFNVAVLAAYPVFFALQVVLANALGAAGLLTTYGFRTAYGVAAVAGAFALIRGRSTRGSRQEAPPTADAAAELPVIRRTVLVTAKGVLAGLVLVTLVSPVHIWDVLAYHMPMVASYVQNGSLDAWPTQDLRQIYRVNAGELQMLNVALLARSDAWVELPNLLGLVVVLTASFELARLAFRRAAFRYLIVLLVITAPQVVIGTATAKNDLVFTAALLCGFYWMIRAGMPAGPRAGAAVLLAAVSVAVAGATKVMGLNVVGAVGLLALALAVRRRLQPAHVFLYGGAAVAVLLLLVGHIYFGNIGRSAVPVGIAPGEIHYAFGWANIVDAVKYYVFDLTLKRLVRWPAFEHDFMHYGYLFPFMLALGIAAAFRQLRERRYVVACLALLGASLFLSVIAIRRPIGWDQRFMIWLVPTLAILSLSFLETLTPRRILLVARVAAILVVGNLALALAVEYDGLFRRSALQLAVTGEVAQYLDVPNRRYLYMKEGLDTLDRTATARDSILYIGTDDSWMYPLWGRRFTRHVEGVRDADHAGARVASRQFRFLVVEAEAEPSIQGATEARAAESGYIVLARNEHRTVFVRDDTGTAPPPPASGT
jgi:hypothetical protein